MRGMMKTLNNISRCQSVFRAEKLSADGLCASHHTFVLAICRKPGCSQEEIAQEICLNKSTVARALNHLEERGYISRRINSENKRQTLIFPTDKMLEILPEVRAAAKEWNEYLCQGISEEELSVFYSVLSKMEERAKTLVSSLEGEKK